MRSWFVVGVLGAVGCATAIDGHHDVAVDASAADAAVVAIDAPASCNQVTTQLLVNGNFDATPIGTGWSETRIDAGFALITPDDGVVEQTAPNKAWMGGFARANANDQLFQDIAIPARTSALALTGFYDVRTGETGAAVRDTATVVLVKLDGTLLDTALATDNTHPKTDWTSLDHAFAVGDLSGQTVRLKLATHNNATVNTETSFFFDTLALTATHCQ